MIHIEAECTFSVAVHDAFTYITDLSNWPDYWPDFVRLEPPGTAQWSRPGDRVTVVQRLLGREVALHLELEAIEPDTSVRYRSRQPGLPEASHERYFAATGDGVGYRLVVRYIPRPGVRGLWDRIVVKRAVARALRTTISNLNQVVQRDRAAR